jgi:DNA-directed RNA polymerase specialized sigma24 family protein
MRPQKAQERDLQILADVHNAQAGDKGAMDRVLTFNEIWVVVNSFCKNPHRQWMRYDKSVEDLYHEVLIKIAKELRLPRTFATAGQFFGWIKAITKSVFYSEFRRTDSLVRGTRLNVPQDQDLQSDFIDHHSAFAKPARQLDDLIEDETNKLWALRKGLLSEALAVLSVAERAGLDEWIQGSALTRVAKVLSLNHPEQARRKIAKILAKLNRTLRELENSHLCHPTGPTGPPGDR